MKKILLVDDDKMFLDSLVNTLSDQNYELDKALSGPEALEKLNSESYDLVILDYKMKPMDGLDVLKRITKAGYDCSVIMITAYGSFELASQAFAHQAVSIFPKPIKADRLKKAVKRVMLERILQKKKGTEADAEENLAAEGKRNILIVDDSMSYRKMIINTLSSAFNELNFIEAVDGTDAIRKLKKYPNVELIFLDINMPHMNGLEFMELKKKSNDLRKIPIVVLTTETQKDIIEKSYLTGATVFMNKPFKRDELIKTLKSIKYWDE